jgi:hypothetical protein
VKSPYVFTIGANQLTQISDLSTEIVNDIATRFPPNSSGWARMWPWNWSTEPILPTDKIEPFNKVTKLTTLAGIDPYTATSVLTDVEELAVLTVEQKIVDLRGVITLLNINLPPLNGAPYVLIRPEKYMYFTLLMLIMIFGGYAFMYVLQRRSHRSEHTNWLLLQPKIFSCIILGFFVLNQPSARILRFVPLGFVLITLSIGILLVKLPKFNNRLSQIVDDMVKAKASTEQSGIWTGVVKQQ